MSEYADATDIVARHHAQTRSVRATVEAHLDQIAQHNPQLNAIVSLRDSATILAEASAMDARGPKPNQPLWGLPVAIKDLSETAGLRTSYGSPLFADFIPTTDSLLVSRLRAAGMLVIGKTNTPEFGLGSHSTNPVHGVTRNPWNPSLSAGGSSGGAAVALATGMLPLADGSDMMGSLRNPAAWNNIYGFRPSAGLVAKDNQGNIYNQLLSTHGPMGTTPRDLDVMLRVIGQPHPGLPVQMAAYDGMEPIDPKGVTIGRIADWGGYFPMENGIMETCDRALDTLSGLGCRVVDVLPKIDPAALWQSWITLRARAISQECAPFYHDPEKRRLLNTQMLWEIERGLGLSCADLDAANHIRAAWFREISSPEMPEFLALPATQMFPFDATLDWPHTLAGHHMDSYHRWMEIVVPASLVGVPAISLPAGFARPSAHEPPLPVGLQIIGKFNTDARVLGLADRYHGATNWPQRVTPPERSGATGTRGAEPCTEN